MRGHSNPVRREGADTILGSIEMHKSSIAEYEWPHGSYWVSNPKKSQ